LDWLTLVTGPDCWMFAWPETTVPPVGPATAGRCMIISAATAAMVARGPCAARLAKLCSGRNGCAFTPTAAQGLPGARAPTRLPERISPTRRHKTQRPHRYIHLDTAHLLRRLAIASIGKADAEIFR